MINVHSTYEDRKSEIEFYYSVLESMDSADVSISTNDTMLFRIMKSNFILMLYNMVEATISTGISEIYEAVKNDHCDYKNVIEEIQNIWRDAQIEQVYRSSTELKAYTNRVKLLVEHVTSDAPLILKKEMLHINGNLNARKIKNICDQHRIRYYVEGDESRMEEVRRMRNMLAHGDESFSQCARDSTLSDLCKTKDIIISFLNGIIIGMEDYCINKRYLATVA